MHLSQDTVGSMLFETALISLVEMLQSMRNYLSPGTILQFVAFLFLSMKENLHTLLLLWRRFHPRYIRLKSGPNNFIWKYYFRKP